MKLIHSTWPQVQAYFKQHDTVIIGTGSCENHGMHLALGTDMLVPERLIDLVEQQRDVLCAPVLPYGSCDYFTEYSGTISLGNEVLSAVLAKVCQGLFNAGARHFIFMNGHGGNIPAIEEVCYTLNQKGAIAAIINWWTMAREFDPAWIGGHGGGLETAAMLYINPAWVDRSAMKASVLADISGEIKATSLKTGKFKGVEVSIPRQCKPICENGWAGPDDVFTATPEWGEKMLHTIADYVVDFLDEFEKAAVAQTEQLTW